MIHADIDHSRTHPGVNLVYEGTLVAEPSAGATMKLLRDGNHFFRTSPVTRVHSRPGNQLLVSTRNSLYLVVPLPPPAPGAAG